MLPEEKSPDAIGDVVTFSFFSNWSDPVILPVTDPSRFLLHRESVGTPRGAFFTEVFGTGTDRDVESPPSPKSEMVLLGLLL